MHVGISLKAFFIGVIKVILTLIVTFLLLFILNGLVFSDGARTRSGVEISEVVLASDHPEHFRLMAFNIAKCFVMEGGTRASKATVESRLAELAHAIREATPDVVVLSEAVRECGPGQVDQVRALAAQTGLTHWAFGECFSFGLPFCRIVSGNAILSRYPLTPLLNLELVGRKPFYITKNNRRALACEITSPHGVLTVWSLHNDSFDLDTNLAQVRQLLDHPHSENAFMAGDFNARPTDPPMTTLHASGRFSGVFDGPQTFPSWAPDRTLDYVLAPAAWRVLDHNIITSPATDHRAVVTTFGR